MEVIWGLAGIAIGYAMCLLAEAVRRAARDEGGKPAGPTRWEVLQTGDGECDGYTIERQTGRVRRRDGPPA